MNKKLECEKSYWERLEEQDDMFSKFLSWLHRKTRRTKKEQKCQTGDI